MKNIFFTCLIFFTVLCSFGQIKVSCIGNSITYGSSLKDPSLESYPSLLQSMLGTEYQVENFGEPGATLLRRGHSPYMLREGFKKALEFKGDIAVIHLGINDTDPRDWPNYGDDFVKDYLSLIDSLRTVNPSVRILVARMTPIRDTHRRFNSGTKQWHAKIQKSIELVAKISKAELINFYEPLLVHPEFYNDDVHPSKEGAEIMANVVYKAITGNYGGLQLPILYSDNMVIQKDRPITISGIANAGEKVTVSFDKLKSTAITSSDGKWSVKFPAISEPKRNLKLSVFTKERRFDLKNVCIGEVWLCSGQSNMEFRLHSAVTANEDIKLANDSDLRLFNMVHVSGNSLQWEDDIVDSVNNLQPFRPARWTECTPSMAAEFSAIAYYFGKMLRDSLDVPVGLILNAVGGSTQESWIDRQTLENYYPLILRDWINGDFTQDWCRERARVNMKNTKLGWLHHLYEPCYLFDTGIRPLGKPEIKGVIWYQGESNEHCYETFEDLFGLFVKSWREWWNRGDLPVYYVQLSSLNRPEWPWVRDMQRRMMDSIDYVGMAVSSDLGDEKDVHPRQKKQVGERLALLALNGTYGFDKLTPSGPLPQSVEFKDGKAVLNMKYSEGLKTSDNKPVRSFEVAEYDGLFYPAEVTIEGNRIKLSSDNVDSIKIVRYGWRPFTDANLVNSANLPATTFRMEVK